MTDYIKKIDEIPNVLFSYVLIVLLINVIIITCYYIKTNSFKIKFNAMTIVCKLQIPMFYTIMLKS